MRGTHMLEEGIRVSEMGNRTRLSHTWYDSSERTISMGESRAVILDDVHLVED